MLKERRDAAQKVADCLFAVEAAIDAALTRAAELNAALPTARADARLSAIVAQDAFEAAAQAQAMLVQARRSIVETHQHLAETQGQIGLRQVAFGDIFEKPPVKPPSSSDERLRVVG